MAPEKSILYVISRVEKHNLDIPIIENQIQVNYSPPHLTKRKITYLKGGTDVFYIFIFPFLLPLAGHLNIIEIFSESFKGKFLYQHDFFIDFFLIDSIVPLYSAILFAISCHDILYAISLVEKLGSIKTVTSLSAWSNTLPEVYSPPSSILPLPSPNKKGFKKIVAD